MERVLCEICKQHRADYTCFTCQKPICMYCLALPGSKNLPSEGACINGEILCPDHVEEYLCQGRGNPDEAWEEDERSHPGGIKDEEDFDEEFDDEEFEEDEEFDEETEDLDEQEDFCEEEDENEGEDGEVDLNEFLAEFEVLDLEGGADAMRVIQACPIDCATDVRGGPYQKGSNLAPEEIAELQGHVDAEEVVIEPVDGEVPYNAVLSYGTTRYLAQLEPPPSQ